MRFFQIFLIVSFVTLSWLGFLIVHEFGHVIAAWLSGGSVSRVVLHPLEVSWTALERNPHPELVAWGGPVFGSVLPFGFFAAARGFRMPGLYLTRFFAGFCLAANGLYLMVDAYVRGGDGGALLQHGALAWQLVGFGALATPVGFWLWHGLGAHFGLAGMHGHVDRGAAITSACLLMVVVVVELFLYK